MMKNDAVNHPSHYTSGKYEVIDIMEDQFGIEGLKHICLGNALKYICRAGKKGTDKELQDLAKARWYLNHYIERVEAIENEQASAEVDSVEYEVSPIE